MGAENSILEDCTWDDEIVCPQGFLWTLSPITKDNGTDGTVFQAKHSGKKESELLQTCAKTLLRLRHPNVIRFLGSGHSSKGFWMATEPVTPLLSSVNEITSQELVAGLQDILQALDFMHSKLGVCHNNVGPSSIYVSKDGRWKLGGMEHSCRFQEATPAFLDARRVFRDEASLSPEEKTGHLKPDLPLGHARDVFAVGALVDALMDMVKEKDALLSELEQQITICVSADPSQRPVVSALLNFPVFKSDFVNMISFVLNVTVKTEEEKQKFFSYLLPKLQCLPEAVIARRLVVPLLSRFVLLDEIAKEQVLPYLLVPRKESAAGKQSVESDSLLSESLYKAYVIPHLCNIFRVHECHIRMILLTYFSSYVHLFSKEQLEEDIFLQVLLGVRDSDDKLVAASLKALADLVPILGGDYVIGGSRKTFFFHGLPKQVTGESESKENGPVNVTTAFSKAGSTLLKDIAAGAKTTVASVSTEDREKKMMERQQRREEAKLKREERRRKLKEKQMQEPEGPDGDAKDKVEDNGPSLPSTIEEVAKMENEKKKGKVSPDFDGLKEGKDDLKKDVEMDTKENADWSEWEDVEGNISDEIEEELKKMSSEHASTEGKVQTSPSPYRSGEPPSPPPVTGDWSDMPEADRSNMTFSEKSASPSHSRDYTISNLSHDNISTLGDADANFHQGNDQNYNSNRGKASLPSPTQTTKSLKLKSPSSSVKSKAATKKSTVAKLDDLGLGYDIKSIEVKTSTPSMDSDFFADMAPTISLPSQKLDVLGQIEFSGMSGTQRTSSEQMAGMIQKENSVQSSMFAVDSNSVNENALGWGADDDLDWENDNF